MKKIQAVLPHFIAILGFVLVAVLYFYPVLQGDKIYQSDIAQYVGMAKEQNDFRQETNKEPFWTNSAFGGMPTYQLGANYPHNYAKKLDTILRFLPRPADYLFLYFLGFYVLLMVLKVDPLKAFFGAIAFGFSTYLIIILGVGHNAKSHAIAYMPMVIAGVLLVFQRKYITGGILTMLAAALEIQANHFQMTYYLLLILITMGIYFCYTFIISKEYKTLFKSIGVLLAAAILSIGVNATGLLATAEFTDFSIRGKSELTFNADGSKNETNSAMKYDYITEYSYGIAESFNLIVPRLFGGGNNEELGAKSNLYEFMVGYGASPNEALQTTNYYGRTYWGKQPIVAAPAYIGAVVFFLAILAMYHDKRKIKYVFLISAFISLLLSWGKNFEVLTRFFIDFVPMYDKFRAVSSIQVVLELCLPVLAMMGLHSFFTTNKENQQVNLTKATVTSIGLLILLFLSKGLFDFSGPVDGQLLQMFSESQDNAFGTGFISALKEDRRSLYSTDLLRSGFFITVAALALWLYIKNKIKTTTAIIIVGVFMVADLFLVDKNYVSAKDFKSAREVDVPFMENEVDKQILSDTSVYRVYDIQGRLQAKTSYFHKSVGGYSAVRPRRMDELFTHNVENNLNEIGSSIDSTLNITKSNAVLNLLNVKYLVVPTGKGEFAVQNPFANGNAWFVKEVKTVNSADAEMKALDSLDSKNVAVLNSAKFSFKGANKISKDSSSVINLEVHVPNYLKYISTNASDGFAVFSEMYYAKGWKATIDGNETPIYNVDYVLRGLQIPAGKHTIEFTFDPQVVKTGSTIALISSIGMLLLIIGGVYFERKRIEKRSKIKD